MRGQVAISAQIGRIFLRAHFKGVSGAVTSPKFSKKRPIWIDISSHFVDFPSPARRVNLREADEYVIGVPVHNFGPSGSLKLWVDQIVRFWETLDVTPSGLVGTLEQKQATFIIAAGGTYAPGSAGASRNYVEPWLRSLFNYLGVTNQRFVIADGARPVIDGKVPHFRKYYEISRLESALPRPLGSAGNKGL
jgi:hypothetical protein